MALREAWSLKIPTSTTVKTCPQRSKSVEKPTTPAIIRRKQAWMNESFSTIPQFTVKEIADRMGITVYALRYYDKFDLFPYLQRTEDGTRLFSEYDLEWVKIVHCLRCTGLPISEIKHYIQLCLVGDDTVAERASIIYQQEENLRNSIKELQEQLKILQKKKTYYQALMENRSIYDSCNPQKKRKKWIQDEYVRRPGNMTKEPAGVNAVSGSEFPLASDWEFRKMMLSEKRSLNWSKRNTPWNIIAKTWRSPAKIPPGTFSFLLSRATPSSKTSTDSKKRDVVPGCAYGSGIPCWQARNTASCFYALSLPLLNDDSLFLCFRQRNDGSSFFIGRHCSSTPPPCMDSL